MPISLRKKSIKQRLWKTTNIVVAAAVIMNLTMHGLGFGVHAASAAEVDALGQNAPTENPCQANLDSQPCDGTIIVQKQFDTNGDGIADLDGATPDARLANWSFTVDSQPAATPQTQTTTETGQLEFAIQAGTYSVAELQTTPGTHLASAVCLKDGQSIGVTVLDAATISDIQVQDGQTMTCTFMNTADTGTITIQKQFDTNGDGLADIDGSTPNEKLADWSFIVSGQPTESSTQTTTNTGRLDFPVQAGTYAVTEASYDSDSHVISATCQKNGQPIGSLDVNERTIANIDLLSNESVACTFINTLDTGTITVHKRVVPLQGPVVEDPTDWSWSNQEVQNPTNLQTGLLAGQSLTLPVHTDYLISESTNNFPADHWAASFQCTANDEPIPVENGGSGTTNSFYANLFDADENLVCWFTNTEVAQPTTPDFSVTIDKSDAVDPIAPSAQETYQLHWTVDGTLAVQHLTVSDELPADLTFVSADQGGTYDPDTRTVTWDLGQPPSGTSGNVSLVATINSRAANGAIITNIAKVCGTALDQSETSLKHCATDQETTTVRVAPKVAPAVLAITKSHTVAGFTNPGKTVTYNVFVTNTVAAGGDTAKDVTVTDVLPAGFTFSDGTTSKTFPLGSIAPGQSVSTSYVVTISGTQLAGLYTNTATAQSSNTGSVAATSIVEVRIPIVLGVTAPEPKLEFSKKVFPTETRPNQIITYTLTVVNSGDADMENVEINDTLPAGFTFLDGTSKKTWTLPTLRPNHDRVMNVDVMVGANVTAGIYKNTAVALADAVDPLTATAQVTVKAAQVLGLAATGVSPIDKMIFVLGANMVAFGALWMSRIRTRSVSLKSPHVHITT